MVSRISSINRKGKDAFFSLFMCSSPGATSMALSWYWGDRRGEQWNIEIRFQQPGNNLRMEKKHTLHHLKFSKVRWSHDFWWSFEASIYPNGLESLPRTPEEGHQTLNLPRKNLRHQPHMQRCFLKQMEVKGPGRGWCRWWDEKKFPDSLLAKANHIKS